MFLTYLNSPNTRDIQNVILNFNPSKTLLHHTLIINLSITSIIELGKEHCLLLSTVKYFWQYWELTTAYIFFKIKS